MTAQPTGNTIVSIQGIDEMRDAFSRAPEIVSPIMQKAIEGGAAILAKYTTRNEVPWFTGNLVHSFREEIMPLIARWFPTAAYAASVNSGSKPHFPPYQNRAFAAWADAHDIPAYVLARSISKKGTKANPFMERIYNAAHPDINTLMGQALEKITAAMATAT